MSEIFKSIMNQYGLVACNINTLLKMDPDESPLWYLSRRTVTSQLDKRSPMTEFFNNAYWADDAIHHKNIKGDIILDKNKLLNKNGRIKMDFDPCFFWVFHSEKSKHEHPCCPREAC